jgi:hypothetical protein
LDPSVDPSVYTIFFWTSCTRRKNWNGLGLREVVAWNFQFWSVCSPICLPPVFTKMDGNLYSTGKYDCTQGFLHSIITEDYIQKSTYTSR